MDKFVIEGGKPLKGTLPVSGAKNASLPLMAAAILAPGIHTIENVPRLRDVRTMAHLLRIIGARIDFEDGPSSVPSLVIDTSDCSFCEAPYELVKTMRASIYVLGPLLARFGKVRVSLPGGCAWGPRPVDLHIMGMEKLGAQIEFEDGYIVASAEKLRGDTISFPIRSVGATGNVMMAACLAEGTTILQNAACEPEIVALAQFINAMGGHVKQAGSDQIVIEGVDQLHPAKFQNIPDRIEAGTFLSAVATTGGDVTLTNLRSDHLSVVLDGLERAGFSLEIQDTSVKIQSEGRAYPVDMKTAPYPGFPTDMQAQWIALMSLADGSCTMTDTIYTNRFTHVAELQRLGADIRVEGNTALIRGVEQLKGAPVMSTDIRASASLIIAGLAAEGRTDLSRVYHIDRGYERIEEKLRLIGADIRREDEPLQV
ncbi:UDP-N-acetylglucosamine 1-carboxyvinyltransferase [candidate division LCP-89 bacterium B3_LCP]|uniref:UDP-N-acetylglucosamine 1-carboxyvinyltransferase n=1 Tax=candidate division LCP-89 bacterium B3_LCP TaxID=2012998 RepID=A0A532V365_UNCL8|nr:MAG: UDP-N-acetylglucosamine 1-carboxyvinyltransferase [candidate division LCP-89 bacterium B3_LCP]